MATELNRATLADWPNSATALREVSRKVAGDVEYVELHRVDNGADMAKVGA